MKWVVPYLLFGSAMWLEQALSLHGLTYAVGILLLSTTKSDLLACIPALLVMGMYGDIASGKLLGMHACVLIGVYGIWEAIQSTARWRFFAYLLLGALSILLTAPPSALGVGIGVLLVCWGGIRVVGMQHHRGEIHLR